MTFAAKQPENSSRSAQTNIGKMSPSFVRGLSEGSELKTATKELFFSVSDGLARVESRIRSRFASEAEQLREISTYLLELGGKRVRPLLAILAEKLFRQQCPSEKLIDAASGIELIHMATLLHDDIIDESPLRRNKESAYRKYGFTSTLLAGDFLWVRAFGLCAHLGEFIVSETEKACVELTEGELLEGKLSVGTPTSLEDYRTIISKKTGSLFALATAVGAHCANAGKEEIDLLRQFGLNAGIAFQMVDDILDVTADETLLGKPSGTDLRQRTPSLVNILWLASGDKVAERFFGGSAPSEAESIQALEQLRQSVVIADARTHAKHYADIAKQNLASLAADRVDEAVRRDLNILIDYTLQRCL